MLSTTLVAAVIGVQGALAFGKGGGLTTTLGTSATCTNPQTSCQNTTVVADLCCFNAPGGQLLQTQFWDTDPSTGWLI